MARRSERRVRVIQDDDEPEESPASSQASDGHDDGYYAVKEVLKERRVNGQRMLLLLWEGYAEPSWEPVEHLDRCAELLRFFDNNYDEGFHEDD
ncbi:chromobox-like protein 5 [Aphelenchoides avenae]|nr:chromobox-like protein 5 [Aphelenchus avenae]